MFPRRAPCARTAIFSAFSAAFWLRQSSSSPLHAGEQRAARATRYGAARSAKRALAETPAHPPAPKAAARRRFRLPIAFEPNLGQADASVQYVGRGMNMTVLLRADGILSSLGGTADSALLKLQF